MENVMLKNSGFKTVSNISEMLGGKDTRRKDNSKGLTTNDKIYFKFALLKHPTMMSNQVFY